MGFSKACAAASSLALAASYLLCWAGIGPFSVKDLGTLILFEFATLMYALPLAALLAGPLRRVGAPRWVMGLASGVLMAALLLVGIVYAVRVGAVWPVVAVGVLLAGKIRLFFQPPRTELESRQIMADAAVRLASLFFLLLPCVLIPLPAWGVPGLMREFGDVRPAGIMVWGVFYFGLSGLFGHRLDATVAASPEAKPTV